EIDWPGVVGGDAIAEVRGKRLGLLLDIGAGLLLQPAVRDAVIAAARTFEQAGAIVEPVEPFLDGEIRAGIDGFFPGPRLAEIPKLPRERQDKALPFIVAWCRRAERLSAVDAANNLALVMSMREKAVVATGPYDFLIAPTSPIVAYSAEEATPGNNPEKPF